MQILWGFGGVMVLLGIAYLFSKDKKAINFRTVLGALAIQLTFAFAVLKWEPGKAALQWGSNKVQQLIGYASAGINFLFGNLTNGSVEKIGFVFAFQVLTVIIFFSSLIAVLYRLGIMQWMIRIIGGGLSKLLKTSKAESMSAGANIFVGQTEAPLVVRPFINKMTQSEFFAVMTGGMASVAGSTLAGYVLLGVPVDYLIAASFMSAPAGLLMAKILVPETKHEEVNNLVDVEKDSETVNVIDAAARGASDGMSLALNVGAMLLAFIGLIALVNGILGGVGGWFGYEQLSMEQILGFLLAPLAFIIGVPWGEAIQAGAFIGQKVVLNEFVAFSAFSPHIEELSDKTVAIVSFALCGFANFGTLAILLGGMGGMAPERRPEIARLGLLSVLGGTLANLLSAAIAGMLI
ncbi:NupC/NupG family nucleoside CNT transporter [Halobacillus shinanisalinarum]|uniref:Nucleoside permease n=1 Tax=Halobacillus shinanisalinarum TaxID=2932258 RepID=A0ABY4H372_9BACI|nr:NupC/NupG family nucleoside CNT transporter [Halobacillus shinanisalinarum]UOQ94741.1 NupC/NupG family nucleoside CNT transporter [Halobacillus shinanisalinarum]